VRVSVTASAVVLETLALAAPALAGTSYPPIAPGPATVLPDFVGGGGAVGRPQRHHLRGSLRRFGGDEGRGLTQA